MQIADKTVVAFDYVLKLPDGTQLESSQNDGEPAVYLHGAGNIIPGLEKALAGKAVGDHVEVTVPPADGYGDRVPDSVQRVPAKYVGDTKKLKPGMQVPIRFEKGAQLVTVVKVGKFSVDVDMNHPLAGLELCFSIDIRSVREALPEEVEHGHAHGADGHAQHH